MYYPRKCTIRVRASYKMSVLNNEAQKCSIESTTTSTTEWNYGGISRAKPLMTNADQASVRLSGRVDCHDFQHSPSG